MIARHGPDDDFSAVAAVPLPFEACELPYSLIPDRAESDTSSRLNPVDARNLQWALCWFYFTLGINLALPVQLRERALSSGTVN